jgi:O-acetyl-ADP-ribose deacetylase (regulator of RNase III)
MDGEMRKIFGRSVEIVQPHEVFRSVASNRATYIAWLGAGLSAEAGVKTGRQICEEIRRELASYAKPPDEETWARAELNWADPQRRYSTCLMRYGQAPKRVRYFRRIIRGVAPAFSHHAIALLLEAKFLYPTCITTNFDKLIEIAFAQHNYSEFQAIRGDAEAELWRQEEDKCYVLKLHGDYDTQNILNTSDETIRIPQQIQIRTTSALKQRGLILFGSSGYESSVIRLLSDALDDKDNTILNLGLYWSVNVGSRLVEDRNADELEDVVAEKLLAGSVSRDIIELLSRHNSEDRQAAFFPVYGAGDFLFRLIDSLDNKALSGRARRYLDHSMRLRDLFERRGLDSSAAEVRLSKLSSHSSRRTMTDFSQRSKVVTRVWDVQSADSEVAIQVLYGDITSRSLMGSPEYGDGRRAVLSPDDTLLSAGGGVALALLEKAGRHFVLGELGKFSTVHHRQTVVTSGGELPVHYIIHGAVADLRPSGTSHTTAEDVEATVFNCLSTAKFLGVETIFVPLVAAGLEGLPPEQSLSAILAAVARTATEQHQMGFRVIIVIRAEATIARREVGECIVGVFGPPRFRCSAVRGDTRDLEEV